ncbi:hypothetical protein GCM10027578_30500 [Spirosoma luteolum]
MGMAYRGEECAKCTRIGPTNGWHRRVFDDTAAGFSPVVGLLTWATSGGSGNPTTGPDIG